MLSTHKGEMLEHGLRKAWKDRSIIYGKEEGCRIEPLSNRVS